MKLHFLGSSDSSGIPVHNCKCEICENYREKGLSNLSSMAYIQTQNGVILLDAGHDNIGNIFDNQKIFAVFLTHFHADHCMGLLRLRHSNDKIECFHPKDDLGFSDLFKHKHSINYNSLNDFEIVVIEGIKFTSIPLKHSKNCFGYIVETNSSTFAYLTDCFEIELKSLEFLKKYSFDYVFIDACYDERKIKGNHLNYLQATKILDSLNSKKSYLMHSSHSTLEYIRKNSIKLKYNYIKENETFDI